MIPLVASIGSTLFMTGVVWFAQLVAYPQFEAVGANHVRYQRGHMTRMLKLVTLPMIIEGVAGLGMLFYGVRGVPLVIIQIAFGLSMVIWASTFTRQAPQHFQLLRGWSESVHANLLRDNWIRTVAWTARSAILLWMLLRALG